MARPQKPTAESSRFRWLLSVPLALVLVASALAIVLGRASYPAAAMLLVAVGGIDLAAARSFGTDPVLTRWLRSWLNRGGPRQPPAG